MTQGFYLMIDQLKKIVNERNPSAKFIKEFEPGTMFCLGVDPGKIFVNYLDMASGASQGTIELRKNDWLMYLETCTRFQGTNETRYWHVCLYGERFVMFQTNTSLKSDEWKFEFIK